MADARYYVVRDRDGWMIKFEDEHYGPYRDHDDAVRLAVDASRRDLMNAAHPLDPRGAGAFSCRLAPVAFPGSAGVPDTAGEFPSPRK